MTTSTAFGRRYELIIGRDAELIERNIPPTIIDPTFVATPNINYPRNVNEGFPNFGQVTEEGGYKDFVTIPEQFISITDVEIKAKVVYSKKTQSTNNQSAVIEVYNLSKSTRDKIRSDDSLVFKAGYEGDEELPLICVGQIASVNTTKKGSNTITRIVCKDGYVSQKNIRFSRSGVKGETYRDVIQDLMNRAASTGIPTGSVYDLAGGSSILLTGVTLDTVIPSGLPLAGYVMEQLSEVCNKIGFKAYISLGKLYVEPIYNASLIDVVVIEQENLKGTIRKQQDSTNNKTNSQENKPGLKIEVYLNGKVTTNLLAQVNVEQYRGTYKIETVTHILDLEKGKWSTEIFCKENV